MRLHLVRWERRYRPLTNGVFLPAVAVGLLAALMWTGGAARAADVEVSGTRLLFKNTSRMLLLSKDALVVPGGNGSSADPRCREDGGSGSGASVVISDGTNEATLTMQCVYWSANPAGTLYKYRKTIGAGQAAKVKAGRLKIIASDLGGFPVPSGPATVNVQVTIGSDRYCMTFNGTGDGRKFLVRDALPDSCTPSQTCGNDVREWTEECDGSDAAACSEGGACGVDCACEYPCGDGVREGTEECDGADDASCDGGPCLTNCTCHETCGASQFPTCGGGCRAGEMCIPTATNTFHDCRCVPEGKTCQPYQSQTCVEQCDPESSQAFGSCPPGQVCTAFNAFCILGGPCTIRCN